MEQILHGCATTTPAIRKALQESTESNQKLAKRYGINHNTVSKWRNRDYTNDIPPGPKNSRSTVLTNGEEAIIVAFRKHTLFGLDDCLYSLKKTIPNLSRSSLHRCLKRHGINKLPQHEKTKKLTKKFNFYDPGYVHIDITQVYTQQGKLYLFVAIDRTTKYCLTGLYEDQTAQTASLFLQEVIAKYPLKIDIILTDNGKQFTAKKIIGNTLPFVTICKENGIEHRLTKPYHPWTNGQVERMNRRLKDATIKKYHYKDHDRLKKHLNNFIMAYNYAQPLGALKGLCPFEEILRYSRLQPEKYKINPTYLSAGRYR